ncbi:hypothetical protein RJ639_016858 [Escallonia herrerae]|uniref:Pentatricopeptide repeat-containing protein-mitochondrial domain-containing protein n=1 Tax=Escallonia herrerae TaxID=1293975 RepID=A0AA88VDS7_9ASTE|nr:hypothetical protein RJ639_016858 [Escallonia herrerae]
MMGMFKRARACAGQGCVGTGMEPVTGSVQMQIINALHLGERSRASTLLSDLGHRNYSLRVDDFVRILEYCAFSPDPLFVMEIWTIMVEKEISMNDKCYLLVIRALCKGGYIDEAFNLLSIVGENADIYPILPMYNNFLGACAQMHSFHHANKCLDLMEQRLVGKNEVTYIELLKLAVLQQNLPAVHELWKEYTRYYNVSVVSLRKFIRSFTRLGDLKSASESLQKMVTLAFRGGFVIAKTAEGKMYPSKLDIPIPSSSDLGLKKYWKENKIFVPSVFQACNESNTQASDIVDSGTFGIGKIEDRTDGRVLLKKPMAVPVMKVLRWSFNDVIHACAQTRNYRLAEQLFAQMQSIGLEPSCDTYDGFIRALVAERGFHDGLQVLEVMQQKNLKPYDSTLATISVACSKDLELDLAEAFLDRISSSTSPFPFNAFLEACDRLDQPERAVRILAKMKQLKQPPDIRTYELLFSLFGNVNAPYEEGNMLSQLDAAKRINAIEVDMLSNGIQHSNVSINNLLKALGTEGMIRELIQYLRVAENQFSHSSIVLGTPIYNTALHSLVEAKESHMAVEIFKTMLYGRRPDAVTYNIMIDCCSIIKCFKSACALVSVMIRDGFCPQVLTYTALIKILLVCEDLDEALNLLDQGCSDAIQPDVLLFNTILQAAYDKGRIDLVELIVVRMHQENVQPDSSTCGYVFSAYADSGFFSTAAEALQVLSMRIIFEDDSSLEEKGPVFEDLILAEDLDTESRIIELFKNSQEDIAVALLNLRWCATVGFPISRLPNQSQWAKRLLSSYGFKKGGT